MRFETWIDPADLSPAVVDVMNERARQFDVEGYTPEHDDEHVRGELALAGASYAVLGGLGFEPITPEMRAWFERVWPFEERPRHKGRRRDLVRAAALILAEIERVDRAIAKGVHP